MDNTVVPSFPELISNLNSVSNETVKKLLTNRVIEVVDSNKLKVLDLYSLRSDLCGHKLDIVMESVDKLYAIKNVKKQLNNVCLLLYIDPKFSLLWKLESFTDLAKCLVSNKNKLLADLGNAYSNNKLYNFMENIHLFPDKPGYTAEDLYNILMKSSDEEVVIFKEYLFEKKKKGGRPSKTQFEKEKKEVCDKLLSILGITDANKIFYFDDLDKNPNKQAQILELKKDVTKYFVYGRWSVFAKTKIIPKPYISLTKSILKACKIKTVSVYITDRTNGTNKKGLQIV